MPLWAPPLPERRYTHGCDVQAQPNFCLYVLTNFCALKSVIINKGGTRPLCAIFVTLVPFCLLRIASEAKRICIIIAISRNELKEYVKEGGIITEVASNSYLY